MMRIFHIATAADWAEARREGTYRTSTRGRSLEEEGFIHAAKAHQVRGVFDRYYRDAREPLVLLTIDPTRLEAECREERVGDDTYPHIFGPVPTRAVVKTEPLSARGRPQTLLEVAIKGAMWRLGVALMVMVGAVGCALITKAYRPEGWWPFIAACAGLMLGVALTVAVAALLRRRRR